jgi:predicted RNA-binding Zn-ribbon protein involved in translation (DUF1610 family)
MQEAELAGAARLPNWLSAAQGCLQPPAGLASADETLRCDLAWDGIGAVAVPGTLLFDFMALSEAQTASVATFASRFGMLGVCPSHGRPIGHSPNATLAALMRGDDLDCRAVADAWEARVYEERADDWRLWAGRFRLVFERISELKRGLKTGREMPASFVCGYSRARADATSPRILSRGALWGQVADTVNVWLRDSGLGPALVIGKDERAAIEMRASPQFAFPILALQLLLFATGGQQVATCSACGRVFAARRRPQAGRDSYCPACGKTAADRAAARRSRAKARSRNSSTRNLLPRKGHE